MKTKLQQSPLPARTERYSANGHQMVILAVASAQYHIPLWILQRKIDLFGETIHRETRRVADALFGTRQFIFIRESQCSALKVFSDHLEQTHTAAADARARGFISVLAAARGLDKAKNVVTGWVHDGCPHLPSHRKPDHLWVATLKGANSKRLFISADSVREIKAALKASPARESAKYIDRPDGRYIHSREAARRCGCTFTGLSNWSSGKVPVPGGGKLRLCRGSRRDKYYHEKDVDAVAANPKREGQRRTCKVARDKRGRNLLPTPIVAEKCGCTQSLVRHWIAGRVPIPNGLPLRGGFPIGVTGRQAKYFREEDVIAIARARGKEQPPPIITAPGTGPRGRGKARLPADEANRRRRILAEWEQASHSNSLKQFCADRGMKESTVRGYMAWAKTRENRGQTVC